MKEFDRALLLVELIRDGVSSYKALWLEEEYTDSRY